MTTRSSLPLLSFAALLPVLVALLIPGTLYAQTVRYLGNAALQVVSEETAVLIDPLWDNDYDGRFQRVPEDMVTAMIAGEAPFEHVEAILVTHEHGDHFDAPLIASFLKAHTETRLIAPLPAADAVRTLAPDLAARIDTVPSETPATFTLGTFVVTAVPLVHASARFADMAHTAYLVEVEGRRIAHLGDATPDTTILSTIAPALNSLDALFVPPWIAFGADDQLDSLRKTLTTDRLLLGHLSVAFIKTPPNDLPPDLTLLREPGQTVVFH